jgi:glycine/D-amino acid oxidase-like deaminating enzyme
MRNSAGVVIVGGGISGCAAAYYLAKRGVDVVLLEKGEIGSEQSGRAWGYVRQQGRHPAELPLMIAASRMWSDLSKELDADLEFIRGGNLVLAETEVDVARFARAERVAKEAGLRSRIISKSEIADIVKGLAGEWAGGLYTADDAHAEPIKTTRAFAAAAERIGAQIYTQCAVSGIELRNGSVEAVVTSRGPIKTSTVVCVAGRWSSRLAKMAGVTLPITAARVSVGATNPAPPITSAGVWGPYVALRQRPTGEIYIGSGYRRPQANHDVTVDSLMNVRMFVPNFLKFRSEFEMSVGPEFVVDVLARLRGRPLWTHHHEPRINERWVRETEQHLYRHFPALRGIGLSRMWGGYIDITPDGVPVIGPVDRPRGFIIAAGFSGHGFALGPITGRLLSEIVCDGKASVDIAPLRCSRFAEGDVLEPMTFP